MESYNKTYEATHKKPCAACGTPIHRSGKLCWKCYIQKNRGAGNPLWKGGAKEAIKRYKKSHMRECYLCKKPITPEAKTGLCASCSHHTTHNNFKGGKIIDKFGYTQIWIPERWLAGKRGYVREHRFIWEQAHGVKLVKGLHIHHINGDKSDNRIENLLVVNQSMHNKIHLCKKKHYTMEYLRRKEEIIIHSLSPIAIIIVGF